MKWVILEVKYDSYCMSQKNLPRVDMQPEEHFDPGHIAANHFFRISNVIHIKWVIRLMSHYDSYNMTHLTWRIIWNLVPVNIWISKTLAKFRNPNWFNQWVIALKNILVRAYYRTIRRAPSCLSWYQVKYQNQKWSFMTSGGQIDRSWWLRLVKWVKCKQKSAAYLLAKTLTEITHLVRFRPDLGFGLVSVLGRVWDWEHQINFATTNLYHQIICFSPIKRVSLTGTFWNSPIVKIHGLHTSHYTK